jgi:hypothetical protein
VLLFPVSKVAHLGDLFFNKRFPFVDLASGGDVLGLQRDIAQLVPQIRRTGRSSPATARSRRWTTSSCTSACWTSRSAR